MPISSRGSHEQKASNARILKEKIKNK
ncbi:hypothetical protein F383_34488 [Gossypium arboreum]|uniref:Uncharacterized protein n=1 Tax=Gossypium arboreum TaxID=29729 RepID=A0A0B0PV29_GOSAR|nr:hypothetical protein F383_34488 [Gossypium arboreum]